ETERGVISRLLESRFSLSRSAANDLLAAGETAASESAELFHFTRIVNERLSFEERVELIEMLWEVAYADGVLDEYEDSLLRRVGGLIYVPDRERGEARQRVLKRLGLDQATCSVPSRTCPKFRRRIENHDLCCHRSLHPLQIYGLRGGLPRRLFLRGREHAGDPP